MLRTIISSWGRSYQTTSATNYIIKQSETVSLLLQASSQSTPILGCKQFHARLIKSGSLFETYVANTLLSLYAKCDDLGSAHLLFDEMPQRNVISWTSLISAHTHHGYSEAASVFFRRMLETSERPNQFTLSVTIRACIDVKLLDLGIQIHGLVIKLGYENDEFAGSSLVDMYFKIRGCLDAAYRVFNGLANRDCVMWNVIIHAFAQVGDRCKVVELLSEMRSVDRLYPNDFTFSSLLKCCSSTSEVEQIHGFAVKCGTEFDAVVSGALVDMYCKCGSWESGQKHLYLMERKDCFVWSSIISGYARNGIGEKAIVLFRDMCRQGLASDQHALSGTLKACVETGNFETGIQAHAQMIKCGYQSDCIVSSVLLTLYGEFGQVREAEKLFMRIDNVDLVAWNSMILSYAQMKEGSVVAAVKCFNELSRNTRLEPDGATFIALIKSCQSDEDLVTGIQIHGRIIKSSQSCDTAIGNAVTNMYTKCGVVSDAYKAFNEIVDKDDISWSSMIGSYEQHGLVLEALTLCKEMLADGTCLTAYSLPPCIASCSAIAAVEVGKQFHAFSTKSGLDANVYIGSSFVDMYAKCGNMEEAKKLFDEQQNPNEVTFNALISGFAKHGKPQEALEVFKDMEEMGIVPNQVTFLALLTACSHAGLIEEGLCMFNVMYQRYDINPEADHFSCLVDAFGRAGRLEEALQLLKFDGGVSAWRTLLSACKNYSNCDIGELSARKMFEMDPSDHASYVLLSNLLSGGGKWEEASLLRQRMASIGVKKDPGASWSSG